MIKTDKEKYWSSKISKFKRSGEDKKEWCKKNNISIHQLNYYLKQENKPDSAARILQKEHISPENVNNKWLPVKIKQEAIFTGSPLIVKMGIAAVEVCPGFDKDHLLEVLKTLKAL